MNYLMFNHDGSIKATNLVDIITQGSNTYVLYIYVEGFDPDDYGAVAKFILPDGEPTTPLIGISSTFQPDGEELTGYKIQLTAAQTLQYGNLECSIEIKDLNDNVLFTKALTLTINKTTYVVDEQTITSAQYDNLVDVLASKQNRFSANNVRCYETLSEYEADLENLSVGQICLVEISKEMKAFIKTATGYERYELGGVFSHVAYLGNLDGSVTISSLYTMAGNAPFTFRYGSMPYIGGFYRPTAGVYELEVEALGSKARFYISGSELPSTPLSTFLDSSTAFYKPYVTEDELEIDLNNKADLVDGKVPLEQLPNVGAVWGNIEGTLSNQTDLQNALNAKQNALTFDNTPTQNSNNPVKSSGIYISLSAKADLVEGKVPASQLPSQGVAWGAITGTLSNQTDLNTALSSKADLVDGKVPSSQLPSYVDDVIVLDGTAVNIENSQIPVITEENLEAITTISDFNAIFGTSLTSSGGIRSPIAFIYSGRTGTLGPNTVYYADLYALKMSQTGTTLTMLPDDFIKIEAAKIYINPNTNKTYRASTLYAIEVDTSTTTHTNGLVEISKSLALGTTAGTAYDGASGASLASSMIDVQAKLDNIPLGGTYAENIVYDAGDLVWYENRLYKALVDILQAPAVFNTNDWEMTSLDELLDEKQDKLPAVTNDKYLHTNATTGALEWSTVSGGMSNPMSAQGDIIYGGSSGTPTALAKGTAGQLLAMNSGATAPEWKTVTLPPMGTAYGSNAVAIGTNSEAGVSGQNYYSTAYGYGASAIGENSTAIGRGSVTINNYTTAIGKSATANNTYATAIGNSSTASGNYSTAIGTNASAIAANATAIGSWAYASGQYSTAIGYRAYTKINYTVSLYGSNSNIDYSTTLFVKDPSHIFFANENSTNTTNQYTSLSSFASGKYLADYLVEPNPTIPSGTTPTALTGLKVGIGSSSTYYSLDGGSSIPTVTIALTQVVQQSPLQVQLTQAQYDDFANNKQVIVDLTALGKPAVVWNYLSGGTSDSEISFGFPELSASGGYHKIVIYTSDLVAHYIRDGYDISPGYIGTSDSADAGKVLAMDNDGWGTLSSIKTVNGSSLLGSGNLAIESVKTGTEGSATSVSLKFWQGTQQQYDAIVTKDANTLYIVKGSSSVSTISFQIQGVSYQAEPEMTWAQWCNSAYNTDGFYVDLNDNKIYTPLGTQYLYNIGPTDTITANTVYILTGGGSN